MSKVLAVTSGKYTPSSRYRIRQHIQGLESRGINVDESCPFIDKNKSFPFLRNVSPKYYLPLYGLWQGIKVFQRLPSIIKSHSYDKVWLNRELLTGYYTLEPLLKRNIILDVDDAIWLNPPFGLKTSKKIAKISSNIICGNEYLANWFSDYNKNCIIIPTSVDVNYLCPNDSEEVSNDIILGWIGTHGNLKYLKSIIKPIIKILNKHKNTRLLIVSDLKPDFIDIHNRIDFKYWSPLDEQFNFQFIDIGLMPLPDDSWANGKCSYKLLQHMSCGASVIGSPVGMNKNILIEKNGALYAKELKDWYYKIDELILKNELRNKFSFRARKFIIENYSNEIIQSKLEKVLR